MERWPSGLRHRIANPAYLKEYREFESLLLRQCFTILGGVTEWFKVTVLKTVEVNSLREFESRPLRHEIIT